MTLSFKTPTDSEIVAEVEQDRNDDWQLKRLFYNNKRVRVQGRPWRTQIVMRALEQRFDLGQEQADATYDKSFPSYESDY